MAARNKIMTLNAGSSRCLGPRVGREGREQQNPWTAAAGGPGRQQLHNLFVPRMHHRPEQGLTATARSIPRSLKFKLFELGSGAGTALKAIASGVCERIGDPDGVSYLRVGAGWVLVGKLVKQIICPGVATTREGWRGAARV